MIVEGKLFEMYIYYLLIKYYWAVASTDLWPSHIVEVHEHDSSAHLRLWLQHGSHMDEIEQAEQGIRAHFLWVPGTCEQ